MSRPQSNTKSGKQEDQHITISVIENQSIKVEIEIIKSINFTYRSTPPPPLKPPLCMSLPHHISCDVMQSAKSIAHALRQTRVDRTRTAGSFFWWYGSSHSLTRTRLDRSTVTKLNLPLTTAD